MSHSKYSPSSSQQWLNCSGSIKMGEMFPDIAPDETYTNEGTAAHFVAEVCLTNPNIKPESYLGKTKFQTLITDEMVKHVSNYIEYVKSVQTPRSESHYEQKVNFIDNGYGTVDAIVITGESCHIIDLKYGMGIAVNAYENTQLKLYALGVHRSRPDIKMFHLHVFQPRMNSISKHDVTYDEMVEFGIEVKHCITRCESSDIEFNPSPKTCQWCSAKANCRALYDHTVGSIEAKIEDNILEDHVLTEVLERKESYKKYVNSVEKRVFDEIKYGKGFNGWKLVEGRSIRKWKEGAEQVLEHELGEKAYSKKLIGLTDAKKLLGKDTVDNLTIKPKGKLTLARDFDEREDVDKNLLKAVKEFENE